MKFPYKKLTNRLNLVMSIFWSLFVGIDFLNQEIRWVTFFKLLIALLYIFQYVYSKKNGYVYVDEYTIKLYKLTTKEIKINTITEITKVFDEYKIVTPDKTIKISTQSLDKDYAELLEEKIQKIKQTRGL